MSGLKSATPSTEVEALEARLVLSAAATVPMPARRSDLVTTGRNPYFILEPGYRTVFAGMEDGQHHRVTIAVLNRTKVIGGIRTRVVRERETVNGHIAEVSINYFAIDKRTKNVYYFGEDVNIFKYDRVINREGSWHHGQNGAKFGMVMAGSPAVGMQFQQERAPGVALDTSEVVDTDATLTVPAGTFGHVLKTRETTALEPDSVEFKWYAPGIGLIKDDTLGLVSHSSLDD
jgi:hypothetical protein